MPVVAVWDGANRRIHLAQGVTSFHPVDDVYREYRVERRTNEDFRKWDAFMRAVGNEPKGGGRFTPRYLLLLDGVKIVPFDEGGALTVEGEVLSDDQSSPFDISGLSQPVVVNYQPAEAEVIAVGGGGVLDVSAVAAAVWDAPVAGHQQAGSFGARMSDLWLQVRNNFAALWAKR